MENKTSFFVMLLILLFFIIFPSIILQAWKVKKHHKEGAAQKLVGRKNLFWRLQSFSDDMGFFIYQAQAKTSKFWMFFGDFLFFGILFYIFIPAMLNAKSQWKELFLLIAFVVALAAFFIYTLFIILLRTDNKNPLIAAEYEAEKLAAKRPDLQMTIQEYLEEFWQTGDPTRMNNFVAVMYKPED